MYKTLLSLFLAFFILACSSHEQSNAFYQKTLFSNICSKEFFDEEMKKVQKNDDVIFRSINTASIARACGEFKLSNEFFDKAEEAYKNDVDLQSLSSKGLKALGSTLFNDNIINYEGNLYERIMLNVYKALNFMNLNDFGNARVEFNRALFRQDKAKDYFAKEINKNKQKFQDAKKEDLYYNQNIEENLQTITKQYEHLFEDFNANKDFTNPYATYLAAVFFFLDKDYKRAYDLLKEVYVLHPNNALMDKEFKVFEKHFSSLNPNKLQKYIFIVYESGLAPAVGEFSLTLPFIVDNNLVSASVTLPTLLKRKASFEYLNVFDSAFSKALSTQNLFDFDSIVASEFRANLSLKITKALISTAAKTSLNVIAAKNDETGLLALASNFYSILSNKSDVRFWNFLPKNAQITMIENKGFIEIRSDSGIEIYHSELDKSKNILIFIRSFSPEFETKIYKIEN